MIYCIFLQNLITCVIFTWFGKMHLIQSQKKPPFEQKSPFFKLRGACPPFCHDLDTTLQAWKPIGLGLTILLYHWYYMYKVFICILDCLWIFVYVRPSWKQWWSDYGSLWMTMCSCHCIPSSKYWGQDMKGWRPELSQVLEIRITWQSVWRNIGTNSWWNPSTSILWMLFKDDWLIWF